MFDREVLDLYNKFKQKLLMLFADTPLQWIANIQAEYPTKHDTRKMAKNQCCS